MTSPSLRPLPIDYQRLCARFNRLRTEEIACWTKDPILFHGMFCAFIFQDDLPFEISDEDIMVNLEEVIENYRWGEFKIWLDVHHDLLIQYHKAVALNSSAGSTSSLMQKETPPRGRNDGDEATWSARSPTFGQKLSPHGKK